MHLYREPNGHYWQLGIPGLVLTWGVRRLWFRIFGHGLSFDSARPEDAMFSCRAGFCGGWHVAGWCIRGVN